MLFHTSCHLAIINNEIIATANYHNVKIGRFRMYHKTIMMLTGRSKRHVALVVFTIVALFLLQQQHAEGFRIQNNDQKLNRRKFTASLVVIPQLVSIFALDPTNNSQKANALQYFEQDRRQKELCLVNLLRLQYWSNTLSEKLKGSSETIDEEKRKSLYLEARLGSKVMVAESKRISGGATINVYMLKGLHIKDCCKDLIFYADKGSKKQMTQYSEDLVDALASIVEFDGLETTQDDSPRSSLTLSMYTSQKAIFVQRMLAERIVPLIDDIIKLFSPDAREQSELFMREYYPSEILFRSTNVFGKSFPVLTAEGNNIEK